MNPTRCVALVIAVVWLASCAPAPVPLDPAYEAELAEHREERNDGLRKEYSWLTLVGLFWLEPGENRFGSAEEAPVRLSADVAPPTAGSFILEDDVVRMVVADGVEVLVDGAPVEEWDTSRIDKDNPGTIRLGRLRLRVLGRGDRFAVRVRDPESPVRTDFTGLNFFDARAEYDMTAAFRPHEAPQTIEIPTIVGIPAKFHSPGLVEFTLNGKTHALEALSDGPEDNEFFMIFKDKTNGKETYGAGRYLAATREGDNVKLDFNKAYNPPCAFTPHATCPLAPPQNRLAVRIEAGEKMLDVAH
ncbi:MAG: DUF1684 domain-containing protein [bacterium]|nr:DUF1684 domain-containing protein [bacterium]